MEGINPNGQMYIDAFALLTSFAESSLRTSEQLDAINHVLDTFPLSEDLYEVLLSHFMNKKRLDIALPIALRGGQRDQHTHLLKLLCEQAKIYYIERLTMHTQVRLDDEQIEHLILVHEQKQHPGELAVQTLVRLVRNTYESDHQKRDAVLQRLRRKNIHLRIRAGVPGGLRSPMIL